MSKSTRAAHSARQAAIQARGSHLTIQARIGTAEKFMSWSYDRGYQLKGVESIRERHIAQYIGEQVSAGVGTRTLQNQMSHIRGTLTAAGRGRAALSPTISNAALGISGASRDGTATAATAAQHEAARAAAVDPGLRASIDLQRHLGLRQQEAIRSGASLATWEKQLVAGERVSVTFGTKGGRPRETLAVDRAQALDAVRQAQKISLERGGNLLPGGDLKTATQYATNQWAREISPVAGITSHQLRYSFAADRVAAYEMDGFSRKEALARTSMDLGHGDGRGRWVERVYLR